MLFKDDAVARAEAKAVRENAGWYRWTHDLVTVTGADAEKFLDWMLVNAIAGTPEGRGKYTTMLDEQGTIIDDLMAFNRGGGLWWLSTLYGPHAVRWFDAHKGEYDVAYEDVTQAWDMYAIQGPNSGKVMEALLGESVDALKRFQIVDAHVGEIAVVVDRFFGHPDQVNAETIREVLRSGRFNNLSDGGFQEGYYPTSEEIEKLFRAHGFSKQLIRSVRGFGWGRAEVLFRVKEKDPEVFETMIAMMNETAGDKAIIETCGHAVYVGQKE